MLQKKFVLTYPIAVFCEISRSIGTGDLTVLQDNQNKYMRQMSHLPSSSSVGLERWQHGTRGREMRIKSVFLTYLVEQGRHRDLVYLGFHGTALQGSQCPDGDKAAVFYPQTNDGLMQQHFSIMLPLIFLGHGHKRRKKPKTSKAKRKKIKF